MEPVGDRIAQRRRQIPRFRKNAGALADEVGVTRQQVSKWENGQATPSGENLLKLAAALDVTPDWILYGDRPQFITPEDVAAMGQRVAEEPVGYDAGATPPQQLLDFLSERLGHRRVAGELTDKDLIAAAYTLARKHGFSTDDYRLLDRWRDQILQGEKG